MIQDIAARSSGIVPVPGFAPHILASWRRCLEQYGLEPDRVRLPQVLTRAELARAREPIDEIVALAQPEVERLFLRLRGYGFIVSLAERGGATVLFRGDVPLPEAFASTRNVLGAISCEERQGTNGIGTCLSIGKPLVVAREGHFDSRVVGFTCIAAPISGAGREPVAVLNVSSWGLSPQVAPDLVLDVVSRSARRIANRFFARRHEARRVLRVSRFGDFGDIGAEGRIAIDAEDRVVDATAEALSLVGGGTASPIGMKVDELPELQQCERIHKGGTQGAGRIFVRLLEPSLRWRPARRVEAVPGTARGPDLAAIQGLDPGLETLLAQACRAMDHALPIMISGETGTGKTALARALHEAEGRDGAHFVSLHGASATPADLDAAFARGRNDTARVTIFVDEVSDLDVQSQARLLILFDRAENTRGGLRVISASRHDLAAKIADRSMRADLYHRLAGFRLDLPALRVRADLDTMIERVFRDEARRVGMAAARLDPAALRALCAHDWPGNFRELRHVVRASLAGAAGTTVGVASLPVGFRTSKEPLGLPARPTRQREIIQAALSRTGWNVRRAAQILGMSRATLHRRILVLRLRRSEPGERGGGAVRS